MPSPNNVLTADSYIQDGLVFQLDGIDYGGVDGQWIDRVGGLVFEGTAQHSDNCFLFKGINSDVMCSRSELPEISDVSAEICCQKTGSYNLIFINGNSVNSLRVSVNGNFRKNLPAFIPYNFTSHATHMQLDRGVDNGFMMNSQRPLNIFNSIRATVGGIQWGEFEHRTIYSPFAGSIYAIRIYNRQLSDREILINQKIDNARFQLGLDIPDEVQPATRSLSLSEPFELQDESMTEQDITNEPSDER